MAGADDRAEAMEAALLDLLTRVQRLEAIESNRAAARAVETLLVARRRPRRASAWVRGALAALALAAASPATAARQPDAYPAAYLVAVICDADSCRQVDLPVYGASRQGCLVGAQAELASRIRDGERIAGWRCE